MSSWIEEWLENGWQGLLWLHHICHITKSAFHFMLTLSKVQPCSPKSNALTSPDLSATVSVGWLMLNLRESPLTASNNTFGEQILSFTIDKTPLTLRASYGLIPCISFKNYFEAIIRWFWLDFFFYHWNWMSWCQAFSINFLRTDNIVAHKREVIIPAWNIAVNDGLHATKASSAQMKWIREDLGVLMECDGMWCHQGWR